MGNHNFRQDFFDAYQSLSDWMMALWLIATPIAALGLVALAMRFKIESKQAELGIISKTAPSIHLDGRGHSHIARHAPQIKSKPILLLLVLQSRHFYAEPEPPGTYVVPAFWSPEGLKGPLRRTASGVSICSGQRRGIRMLWPTGAASGHELPDLDLDGRCIAVGLTLMPSLCYTKAG